MSGGNGGGGGGGGASVSRVYINCDDIADIWKRFPGLDPATPDGQAPEGMLVLGVMEVTALGTQFAGLVRDLAVAGAPYVAALQAAWERATETAATGQWAAIADPLVAGLGLGLAVPRQVAWRRPAAFAVAGGGLRRGRGRASGRDGRPPFLRFEFLPGGGKAAIGLLHSSLWPGAETLLGAAEGRDFAQTLQSYGGPQEDMIAYGSAGGALRVAGVLVRSGVGLQPTARLAVPVLTHDTLSAVTAEWHGFVSGMAGRVSARRAQLEDGLRAVFGGAYPPGTGAVAQEADYLDAAYAVLADLVYKEWRETGTLAPGGGRQVGAGSGSRARLLPWAGGGGQSQAVRALLLERPAAIWQWLITGTNHD
jgi:hypothetical protein